MQAGLFSVCKYSHLSARDFQIIHVSTSEYDTEVKFFLC